MPLSATLKSLYRARAWVQPGNSFNYQCYPVKGIIRKQSILYTYIYLKKKHTQQKKPVICLFTYMSDQYNIHFVIMHIRYKHQYLLFKKMR